MRFRLIGGKIVSFTSSQSFCGGVFLASARIRPMMSLARCPSAIAREADRRACSSFCASSQRTSTSAEFDGLQVTQRPTFLLRNSIGDRVVFSGLARVEPLAAAMDALLADEAAYVSWRAHFGDPPPN